MRLIDALKFLVSGQGHDPDTGLADRDRVLSRALMIVGAAFGACAVAAAGIDTTASAAAKNSLFIV